VLLKEFCNKRTGDYRVSSAEKKAQVPCTESVKFRQLNQLRMILLPLSAAHTQVRASSCLWHRQNAMKNELLIEVLQVADTLVFLFLEHQIFVM
jgi:hypothetical protein